MVVVRVYNIMTQNAVAIFARKRLEKGKAVIVRIVCQHTEQRNNKYRIPKNVFQLSQNNSRDLPFFIGTWTVIFVISNKKGVVLLFARLKNEKTPSYFLRDVYAKCAT